MYLSCRVSILLYLFPEIRYTVTINWIP